MNHKYTTDQRLEFIEKLLFLITPARKLPPDMQERAAELFPVTDMDSVTRRPRSEIALLLFKRLVKMSREQRKDSRFPKVLIAGFTPDYQHILPQPPIVPLSLLLNRCKQRKDFHMQPGDISHTSNVLLAVKKVGLIVTTLGALGLRDSDTQVVITRETAVEYGLKGYVDKSSKKPTPKTFAEPEEEVAVVKKPVSPYADWGASNRSDEDDDDDKYIGEAEPEPDDSDDEEPLPPIKPKKSAKRKIAARNFEEDEEMVDDLTEEQQVAVAEIRSKVFGTPEKFTDPHETFDPPLDDEEQADLEDDDQLTDEDLEEEPTDEDLSEFQQEQIEDEEDIPRFSKSDWDDFETEGDQPEHHPFEDFSLAGEQEKAAKVQVFVRKK